MIDAVGLICDSKSLNSLIEAQNNTVFIVDSGAFVIEVNFKRHTFQEGQVGVLFSDEIVSVDGVSDDFSIRYLTFPLAVIEDAIYRITSPYFWHTVYENPVFMPEPDFMEFINCWYKEAAWIIDNIKGDVGNRVVNNLIFNLLVSLEYEFVKQGLCNPNQPLLNGWTHLFNFLRLVDKHCERHHVVKFYADRLNITTTYLNKIANRLWGVNPKEILNRQILIRIKKMLLDSDMTVSEISYRMNFEDSSYLARYFKRMSGQSPIEFRERQTLDT